MFKMSSSWIEELLENDYSHIDMVATDINHRGKGYLNEMFKAILKDDEIYTIETHNLINVNVYEKYDFELVKKKKLENTDLIQYCMIRRLRK